MEASGAGGAAHTATAAAVREGASGIPMYVVRADLCGIAVHNMQCAFYSCATNGQDSGCITGRIPKK